MSCPVHWRVLVFLGWDIRGRGDVSVCVPGVALTSMLSPCCGLHLRGGGRGGTPILADESYENENLWTCWIIPDSWFREGDGLQTVTWF